MTTAVDSTSIALPTAPPSDHGVEVGAIFVAKWDWEQTNIDFYQVTRVPRRSSKCSGSNRA